MLRITLIVATVLSLAFTPLSAQDLQNGYGAYEAGDYATALQEWTPLAEAGDVDAQYNLGQMYRKGHGVLQDYVEAFRWYRLAADQGHAYAQSNLGYLYETGRGVLQDYAEAVRWYRLGADQGHAYAQSNLGYMYESGQGVLQDYAEAVRWYRLAADQGYARAQFGLGFMYDNGFVGTTKDDFIASLTESELDVVFRHDYAEAVRWYRLAAVQGHTRAQINLGASYANGDGVPQDNVMAHMWVNISAANGDEVGGTYRDRIAERMIPSDISKAQQMARDCMNSGYQNCGY